MAVINEPDAPMTAPFDEQRLQDRLAEVRAFLAATLPAFCVVVQFTGPDATSFDIPVEDVEREVDGLLREAFYVEWAQLGRAVVLKVWEYPYEPVPPWPVVYQQVEAHAKDRAGGEPAGSS